MAVPHLAPYSVSKFASAGLGQALRSELAREGITVTTVLPGLMRTGSPMNASVKGRHAQEYAWFATADSLPVVSLDAREAARRIVNALVRGDAETMVGGPAWLLRVGQALAPQLTADLMVLTNRLLPAPAGADVTRAGRDVEGASLRKSHQARGRSGVQPARGAREAAPGRPGLTIERTVTRWANAQCGAARRGGLSLHSRVPCVRPSHLPSIPGVHQLEVPHERRPTHPHPKRAPRPPNLGPTRPGSFRRWSVR